MLRKKNKANIVNKKKKKNALLILQFDVVFFSLFKKIARKGGIFFFIFSVRSDLWYNVRLF